MCDFGLPELPGSRPSSGEPTFVILVNRSRQEPGLAPNNKMRDFGLPELPGAGPGFGEPKIYDFGLP